MDLEMLADKSQHLARGEMRARARDEVYNLRIYFRTWQLPNFRQ